MVSLRVVLISLCVVLTAVAGATVTIASVIGGREQPADGAIQFRDVSATAGLVARLENYATAEKHLIETMPGGVAAFDYNNDGRIDIFLTNGAPIPSLQKESRGDWNRLYRNDGGMKFTDVTEAAGVAGAGYSMGAAAADFDNDGYADLFV